MRLFAGFQTTVSNLEFGIENGELGGAGRECGQYMRVFPAVECSRESSIKDRKSNAFRSKVLVPRGENIKVRTFL